MKYDNYSLSKKSKPCVSWFFPMDLPMDFIVDPSLHLTSEAMNSQRQMLTRPRSRLPTGRKKQLLEYENEALINV